MTAVSKPFLKSFNATNRFCLSDYSIRRPHLGNRNEAGSKVPECIVNLIIAEGFREGVK